MKKNEPNFYFVFCSIKMILSLAIKTINFYQFDSIPEL